MNSYPLITSQLKLFLSHYGYTAAAIVLIGIGTGCALFDPKVADPSDPSKQVNREGLSTSAQITASDIKAEFASIDAQYAGVKKRADDASIKYKSAYETLDQKDETRIKILGVINDVVTTVPSPVGGLASSGLAILASGLALDNRRKDKQIQQRDTALASIETAAGTTTVVGGRTTG